MGHLLLATGRVYEVRLRQTAGQKCHADRREDCPLVGEYKAHPKTRLLASVYKAITQVVPADPDHPDFRLGKTLGAEHANWHRVKKGMPDRCRLFFRFASKPVKLIVYVWFNDEDTLRKAGAKTDVYEVFRHMLSRGQVPSGITELQKSAGASRSGKTPEPLRGCPHPLRPRMRQEWRHMDTDPELPQ